MRSDGFWFVSKQLEILNKHIAKSRKGLEQLLQETRPNIILRDGSTHSFKREELEKLAGLLPAESHRNLKLPLYIELSPQRFGRGTARISGRLEGRTVLKVLGIEKKEWMEDELFLYRPDVRRLRRRLPTTTQYMFTVELEEDQNSLPFTRARMHDRQ